MATIKSFTDLSQSKVLAEILSHESADMGWNVFVDGSTRCLPINDWDLSKNGEGKAEFIPCWSLTALLDVLPEKLRFLLAINDFQGGIKEKYGMCSLKEDKLDCLADNPVDACVAMIIKLHELKML